MTVVVGVEKCGVWFGADEEVGGKGWKTMSAEEFVIQRLPWPNKPCRVVLFVGKSLLEDWRKMWYGRRRPALLTFINTGCRIPLTSYVIALGVHSLPASTTSVR